MSAHHGCQPDPAGKVDILAAMNGRDSHRATAAAPPRVLASRGAAGTSPALMPPPRHAIDLATLFGRSTPIRAGQHGKPHSEQCLLAGDFGFAVLLAVDLVTIGRRKHPGAFVVTFVTCEA